MKRVINATIHLLDERNSRCQREIKWVCVCVLKRSRDRDRRDGKHQIKTLNVQPQIVRNKDYELTSLGRDWVKGCGTSHVIGSPITSAWKYTPFTDTKTFKGISHI